MTAARAVLLDALGTLLALEPPAPLLRRQLAARFGLEIDEAAAKRAMTAEMAFYRDHHLEGGDRARLAALRARCTEVLRQALGAPATGLPAAELQQALLASLRFSSYPDVREALERLRRAGLRLVVISNWDCSLHDVLAATELAGCLDGALTSAELGAAKPDPAIFRHALTMAAVRPEHALHVGDSPREDVEGARAAGIEPVLLRRDRAGPRPDGVRVVGSLAEVADMAA